MAVKKEGIIQFLNMASLGLLVQAKEIEIFRDGVVFVVNNFHYFVSHTNIRLIEFKEVKNG